LTEQESLENARSKILRWLCYRSRSCREAELYLQKYGYGRSVIRKILAEMQEYRYLDDLRFTEEHIQYCLQRGFGPIRVCTELNNKGVDRELIRETMKGYFSPEQDLLRAAALVERRLMRDFGPPDDKWLRRQVSFLKGRGFSAKVIAELLLKYSRETVD